MSVSLWAYEEKKCEGRPCPQDCDRCPRANGKGTWVKISPALVYECSNCGGQVCTGDIEAYKFCHHCGVYMEDVIR